MPHIVDTLRTLLKGKAAPSSGVVHSLMGAQARVRTSRGISTYPLNGFAVIPGQRVALNEGGIVGVSAPIDPANVYDL